MVLVILSILYVRVMRLHLLELEPSIHGLVLWCPIVDLWIVHLLSYVLFRQYMVELARMVHFNPCWKLLEYTIRVKSLHTTLLCCNISYFLWTLVITSSSCRSWCHGFKDLHGQSGYFLMSFSCTKVSKRYILFSFCWALYIAYLCTIFIVETYFQCPRWYLAISMSCFDVSFSS